MRLTAELNAATNRITNGTRMLRYSFWLDEPAKLRCQLGEEYPCVLERTLGDYRVPILAGKM